LKNNLGSLSLLLVSALSFTASASDIPTRDPQGAHDHPVITRFAGSVIMGYEATEFDAMTLPMGAFKNNAFEKTESAKGHITRIAYVAPPGKSVLEISTNFEQELQKAGFQKRYSCYGTLGDSACGNAYDTSQAVLPNDVLWALSSDAGRHDAMINVIYPTGDKIFIETARLNRKDAPLDIVLMVSGEEGKPTGIYLQICESKAMATGQVTVDAKAMAQGLSQDGHIPLYGIHFGTNSATINADSNSTLGEMASLMKSQPELKVYIVGHTDNSGSLENNLTLSSQRAQAVVKALQDMGVPANRMAPKGMASFSPVATNETDEGKARNRRVELVKQ
jgi:outer membrane protein OmpA-like peptidoglycan-associated protein